MQVASDGSDIPLPPEDEVIMDYEQEIHGAARAVPLIGPPVSIDILKEQYAANPGFLPKVDGLATRFASFRSTRPDGNCFYRAYLFGIFEQLAGEKAKHAAFSERLSHSLDFCSDAGYEKGAIEDFYEEFMESLKRLMAEGSCSELQALFEENDDYLICWSRVLTSAYLKRHEEDYEAFLSSHTSIHQFCAQEVDPMKTEADHLQITALSNYFGVPVCVVYLDRSDGDSAAEHHFQADSNIGSVLTLFRPVHLLYRPGHYDIIYLK